MVVNDAMLDPVLKGINNLTSEQRALAEELDVNMWQKAAAANTVENIAEAIIRCSSQSSGNCWSRLV